MAAASLSYPSAFSTPRADEFRIEFDDDSLPPAVSSQGEDAYAAKVRHAGERLAQLREEQQQLEQEKFQLESLNRKQAEFAKGRLEIEDSLRRGLVELEREGSAAQRQAELCRQAQEDFTLRLEALEALHPEEWNRAELVDELDRGLGLINGSRLEMERSEAQLAPFRTGALNRAEAPLGGLPTDFRSWAMAGLAFTLPVLVLGLIATLLFLVF
jgi:uncharacterized protein involved in type VI secretion and phage assembly